MATTVHLDDAEASRLRRNNLVMAVLHAVQGVAVVVLATDFTLPVTSSFLAGPPGSGVAQPETVWDLNLAWGVATFLFLSSVFHLVVGLVMADRYLDQLSRGQNHFRWIEYSLSSSVMIVLIAMLTGISDGAALLALFGVNAGMIFMGSVQERYEEPGGSLLPFWLGCVLGVVPWLAIGWYLVSPGSEANPPGFVYGIFVSLFIFFNIFALVQWLQYREVGRWSDYLTGERTYIVLSLVAKSALAWQVFAGTLAN
jgi:hypothetical protein